MNNDKYQLLELHCVRLVQGHFTWCGDSETSGVKHHIRHQNNDGLKHYIAIVVKKPDNGKTVEHYTVRQHPEGKSFDYRHSDGTSLMFFQITDDPAPLITTKLDWKKPFYVFTHDKKYRSQPIHLDALSLYIKTPNEPNCSICDIELGSDFDLLLCGHRFHLSCLLETTNQKYCDSCSFYGREPAVNHYFKLNCPLCNNLTI